MLDECAIGRAAKVFTGGWKVICYATIDSPTESIMKQRVRTSNPVRSVRLRHGILLDDDIRVSANGKPAAFEVVV